MLFAWWLHAWFSSIIVICEPWQTRDYWFYFIRVYLANWDASFYLSSLLMLLSFVGRLETTHFGLQHHSALKIKLNIFFWGPNNDIRWTKRLIGVFLDVTVLVERWLFSWGDSCSFVFLILAVLLGKLLKRNSHLLWVLWRNLLVNFLKSSQVAVALLQWIDKILRICCLCLLWHDDISLAAHRIWLLNFRWA